MPQTAMCCTEVEKKHCGSVSTAVLGKNINQCLSNNVSVFNLFDLLCKWWVRV